MNAQPSWDDMVLVGRVGGLHGIRGQVAVNAETDFAEDRFTPGAAFWTRGGQEQLTVATVRFQNGKPIVGFAGVATPEDAERLRGLELRMPEESLRPLEPGVYYHHQLEGCVVETVGGERVGTVTRIDGGLGGSLLVIDGPRGEVLIPLALDICVVVDIAARRVVVAPPEGLLDVNERNGERDRSGRSGRSGRSERWKGRKRSKRGDTPGADSSNGNDANDPNVPNGPNDLGSSNASNVPNDPNDSNDLSSSNGSNDPNVPNDSNNLIR